MNEIKDCIVEPNQEYLLEPISFFDVFESFSFRGQKQYKKFCGLHMVKQMPYLHFFWDLGRSNAQVTMKWY